MSRTYYSKNDDVEDFDVNISGTQILSHIHEQFKLDKADYSETTFQKDDVDPPWKATKTLANKIGTDLQKITDEEIIALFPKVRRLFDGTEKDFVEFVRSWQEFLLSCNGYKT